MNQQPAILHHASRMAILATIALFLMVGCSTGVQEKKVPEITRERSELLEIRKRYETIDCLRATFDLSIRNPETSRSARGILLAESASERMHLVLKDRIFGIQISEVTIAEEKARVNNTGEDPVVVPLEVFSVSGLGYNSIVLPFGILQDLMFGRIPDEVFAEQADVRRIARRDLVVDLDRPDGEYQYLFTNNRLDTITYKSPEKTSTIRAELRGQMPGSMYPKSIKIEGVEQNRVIETVSIRFRNLSTSARCPDSAFRLN